MTVISWRVRAAALFLFAGSAGSVLATTSPGTRTVSFDTDEGTWMSLDVAPDGRRIVFDLLGDIYLLDLAGGVAQPLLTGDAFETQPVFSPDGKRLAFISDRNGSENLWIAEADGSKPQQLSENSQGVVLSPAWSADGNDIYITQFNTRSRLDSNVRHSIHVYSRLGGGGRALAEEAGDGALQGRSVAPSANGRYLYYADNKDSPGSYAVYQRDLRTAATRKLLGNSNGSPFGAMQPLNSPDGKLLAYAEQVQGKTALRVRNLETGDDRRVAYPIEQALAYDDYAFQGLLPRYSFTPDSQALVIGYGGKLHRIDARTGATTDIPFTVKVALAAGSSLRLEQREETGAVRARLIQFPRLSPDGGRLAFTAFGKLYVMSSSGGRPRRLTTTPLAAQAASENQPTWSPDGRWIAYSSWSQQGGHLWVVRADGSTEPRPVTHSAAYYRKPVFAPDGKSLIALRSWTYDQVNVVAIHGANPGRSVAQDLVKVAVDSGRVELVTQLPNSAGAVDHGSLRFVADGSAVLVHTRQGILRVPLDRGAAAIRNGEPRAIAKVQVVEAARTRTVSDMLLSPDGKWALVLQNRQLHVLAMPVDEQQALHLDLANPGVAHRQVTAIGADYFDWADDGKSVVWSVGATLYRVPLERILTGPSATEQSGAGCAEDRFQGMDIVAEQPRDVPTGVVVLRGGKAVTMRGDEIIDGADIVIAGNRIVAVGKTGAVAVPAGADIRDVAGMTLTPGFADTHAHYWHIGRDSIDYGDWEHPIALAYGITASIDPQSFTADMFVYQDLIDMGVVRGPRAYTTGPGIFAWNGVTSSRHAACLLKRYQAHYRTNNIKSYMIGNRMQRQFVVQAARELGMMPIAENWGVPRYALTQAIDGFASNEHATDAVDYYRDVAMLYAQTGTGYSPTTLIGGSAGLPASDYFLANRSPLDDALFDDAKLNRFTPRIVVDAQMRRATWAPLDDFIFPRLAASAAKIFRAGGIVGLGSHGEVQGLGYHWEMQSLAMGGLTPHEVLQIATRGSATVLGRLPEMGSIEPGKFADLIVFDADPLVDIRNTLRIAQVMKNGRLYDAATLTEVWPTPRPAEH